MITSEMGPLITKEHLEKVKGYVDSGVKDGASLVVDGRGCIWADEYDAVVKRGKDLLNLESVQKGNKDLAKALFQIALLKGLATPPGVNFSLVNEFGNGVKAYWVGAQMNPFPINVKLEWLA